jgi:glycosyltransferase involved in cell wall biosynthesis
MRVLEINTVCSYGSIGRISTELARMLEKKGDECLIAYGRGGRPDGVQSFRFGSRWSVYLHVAMSRITDRHGYYSKQATRQLIRKIREYDPDLIHLHNVHGYYVNLELLFTFLRQYGRPVVWTLHDCWSYTGHCAYYSAAECDRWRTVCGHCPQKRAYPGSIFLDHSKVNYQKKREWFTSVPNLQLVTPSEWLKKEVEHSFFSGTPCEVIPNGINLELFRPVESDIKQRFGIGNRRLLLGVANIWDERKGLQDFIALSSQLSPEYQIVLIGLARAQIADLPKNILGLERTQNTEELAAWYSASDIYINTSIEETMGLTTAEAICCGTPVIAYDATAIPETVKDGCGIVVEAGNVGAVVSAVAEIEASLEQYRNSCIHTRPVFRSEAAYGRYYELYNAVLNRYHNI